MRGVARVHAERIHLPAWLADSGFPACAGRLIADTQNPDRNPCRTSCSSVIPSSTTQLM